MAILVIFRLDVQANQQMHIKVQAEATSTTRTISIFEGSTSSFFSAPRTRQKKYLKFKLFSIEFIYLFIKIIMAKHNM